jgi:GT2 family glycosyltransferase
MITNAVRKVVRLLPEPVRFFLLRWRERVMGIISVLKHRKRRRSVESRNYPKRASVIVVTYGNEDYTIGCFDSLRRTISLRDEVIWVDNNSSKESKEKVLAWVKNNDFPQLGGPIFNSRNAGFIGGNKLGFEKAQGRYIVLLNNDTIPAPHWLDNMLAVFDKDYSVGIVGAVSSSPDQWQGVANLKKTLPGFGKAPEMDITNPSFQTVSRYGKRLEDRLGGQYRIMRGMVAFYAAVFSRELVDTVGFLDPEGLYDEMGLSDDDDYCERAKEAGFKLALAMDSFVFHYHRSTFKKLKIDYKKIKLENAMRFNERWGHRRKIPLDKAAENP